MPSPNLRNCLLAVSLSVPTILAQTPVRISEEAALQNLIHRVDPVYPDLAGTAGISGIVRLEVIVTTAGSVADVRVIGGHPLLIQAAADAIVRWRFKPFVEGAQGVPVRVRFEVPFFLNAPHSTYERVEIAGNEYYKRSEECQTACRDRRYHDAEPVCEAALKLADRGNGAWNNPKPTPNTEWFSSPWATPRKRWRTSRRSCPSSKAFRRVTTRNWRMHTIT